MTSTKHLPFGADTVEFAGGNHYNGHPANQTIGHWLTVRGYDNFGGRVFFADPSTSVWTSADPYFDRNTTSFTNAYLQSNGTTW